MRKVTSVIIAIVMLVTTSGFTISSHFCAGKRVKTAVSVIGNADVSCGMEKEKKENNCDTKQIRSNCCKDEFHKIQIDQNYTHQITKVQFSSQFTVAFATILYDLLFNPSGYIRLIHTHSPPLLVKDIPVLVQSFLI